MYYLNPSIEKLYRIFDQNERKDYVRLDLNENPGGLPQGFINDVLDNISADFISQYPETLHFTEVLAEYLGTDIEHICLTNGSSEAIRYIIEAFTSENGRIVGVTPSYMMFQVYSKMYNRNFVEVQYSDDLTMNVDNIIKELTGETQLLVIVNPNNPMGNVYSEEDFERIIRVAEKMTINVLVDEAYFYFYPNSFIKYALENEHIFVTRTFSKLFSMAGCRLGYVVGWPQGIEMVQKLCTPHNTNAFALRFAEALISKPAIVEDLIKKFNEGRAYLISWLDSNNYQHVGEAGNFIFIIPKIDSEIIVKRMKEEKKILIKSYSNVGRYGNCLRVSIGEKKYMQIFTDALEELDR